MASGTASSRRRSVRAVKSISDSEVEADGRKRPRLGKREDGDNWHPKVKTWWGEVWGSPVTSFFDSTDELTVWTLADLMHRRLTAGSAELIVKYSIEARQLANSLGLSPKARQQMKVEIDKGDAAERRTRERKNRAVTRVADGAAKDDPRAALSG